MGFSAALSVQEYWKLNISKNISILTVFLFGAHNLLFGILYFLIGNILLNIEKTSKGTSIDLSVTQSWFLVLNSLYTLPVKSKFLFTLIFKFISVAQVLTDLQSGSQAHKFRTLERNRDSS